METIVAHRDLHFPGQDWLLIRQALSLALLKNTPITIGGGGLCIESSAGARPLFDDMAGMIAKFGAGRLAMDGTSLVYEPRPLRPGTFRFESDRLGSSVELLLFLMPALFHCDFRSIVELDGVTHSPRSCPTAFVKETILEALARIGFYGSLTLRRFGFHGSGGGSIESRIYPREGSSGPIIAGNDAPSLTGVKIIISRLDTGLAELEKTMIAERLGIDAGRIAIIEVMESDGPGNGVQVFASYRGLPVVLFREMSLYDDNGELSFSEDDLGKEIDGLAGEARLLMEGALPERITRELYPYLFLSGTAVATAADSPGAVMTGQLCEQML